MNISANTETGAKQQAFAFGDFELGEVVGNSIFQSRISNGNLEAIARDCAPRERVLMKPTAAGATSNFQLNSGSL